MEKFPYRLFYKIHGGAPRRHDDIVNATKGSQALAIFKKKYPYVRDYEAIGEVWVEIDNEELQKRKDNEKMRAEREQEFLQKAWWNQ